MQLLRFLGNNIYNPSFYLSLKDKSFSYSLKYYFFLVLFTAVIITIIFSILILIPFSEVFWKIRSEFNNIWPAELELQLQAGEIVSVSPHDPYALSVSEDSNIDLPMEYLLTIDTKTLDKNPLNHNSLLLMTKDTLYLSSGKTVKPAERSLSHIFPDEEIEINRAYINRFFTMFERGYKLFLPLIVVLLFIFFFLTMTMWLLVISLVALFVQLILKKYNLKINYLKALQYSLHGATGGMILAWLPPFFSFDLLFSIPQYLFLAVGILLTINLNFAQLRKTGQLKNITFTK